MEPSSICCRPFRAATMSVRAAVPAGALALTLLSMAAATPAAALEAALIGAWAQVPEECSAISSGSGKSMSFKKPVKAFAQAFIISANQVRTPNASCRINGVKTSGTAGSWPWRARRRWPSTRFRPAWSPWPTDPCGGFSTIRTRSAASMSAVGRRRSVERKVAGVVLQTMCRGSQAA